MAPLSYLNFDLTFESSTDGYTVRATSSVAGEARAAFVFPFNELELENFLLRLGQRSSGTRGADSPEMELSKQFGGRLFAALFDDDVRAALRSSISESERRGAGLRIRLRFGNAPELADIPWEYLYDRGANRFLTLSGKTPLVRYLDQNRPVEPLQVQPPLRILVMISDPSDYDQLDVEAEWQRLNGALAELRGRGLVEIVRLDKATLLELQRALRGNQFHIFHYIGHGVYDAGADGGFLVLEDEKGRGRKVGGQYVGTLLAEYSSLRLALLNSCEGGRSSRSDPFAGVAQSLVQQGLPAVVAMQFAISDDAAAVFAQEFYLALAGGYPVDAAVAEGRRAIYGTKTNAEWGIPVLFMRAADGLLFEWENFNAEMQRRREEEERQKAAEAQKRKEEVEQQKAAEAQKFREEEERQKTAEAQKRKEEIEQQKAVEAQKGREEEERQKAVEAQKGREEEERQKVAETQRRREEEERQKAVETQRRKEEEERQRTAEAQKRREEEERQRTAEAQRRREKDEEKEKRGERQGVEMPGVSVRPPLEFDWVTIPAGEFLMGSQKLGFFDRLLGKQIENGDPMASDDETPQHTLYLPDFRIARVPVTNAQYFRFVEATKYQPPSHWKDGRIPDGKEDHPVVQISWHDAIAFCAWAKVQLPSEAEWEKAARGTDGRIWPWGNQPPDKTLCNFDNNVGDTTPAGAYPAGASPYGVLDMAGNVWEWTRSLKADYPYRVDDGREDLNRKESRVLRGGSFYLNRFLVRCASRFRDFPDDGFGDLGFRLLSPGS